MIKVLNTLCIEWNDYVERLPFELRDIYFTREYYALYEKEKGGEGKLFIYEDDEGIGIYPFILREIKEQEFNRRYYDIETAYGYGGPIVNNRNKSFTNKFERAFLGFCIENNVIAEFIRFHPLLDNYNIFAENIEVSHNRITTYIDLNKTIEDIWKEDIIAKNRNMIGKAKRLGVKITQDDEGEDFIKIYLRTMDRLNANKEYYYSNEYFQNIMKVDKVCFNAKIDEVTIASAIFLKSYGFFHYHLAGSLKEYLSFAPNNLLLWTAIEYAKQNGYHKFHFGGGLLNSNEDKLYKFKKSFCRDTSNFYIGKRVHNIELYSELIRQWEEKNDKKAQLFLQYKE